MYIYFLSISHTHNEHHTPHFLPFPSCPFMHEWIKSTQNAKASQLTIIDSKCLAWGHHPQAYLKYVSSTRVMAEVWSIPESFGPGEVKWLWQGLCRSHRASIVTCAPSLHFHSLPENTKNHVKGQPDTFPWQHGPITGLLTRSCAQKNY